MAVIIVVIFLLNRMNGNQYEIAAVARGQIVEEVSASGYVEAPKRINLHFKSSGRLVSLNVAAGNRVQAGQVLARQDASATDSERARMQASLEAAVAERDRLLPSSNGSASIVWRSGAEEKLAFAIEDAYVKADDAVRKRADKLFTHSGASLAFGIQFNYGGIAYNLRAREESLNASISATRRQIGEMLSGWPIVSRAASADILEDSRVARENLTAVRKMLEDIALVINSHVSEDSGGNMVYEEFKNDISIARQSVSSALDALIAAETGMRSASSELSVREAQVRQAQAQLSQINSQIKDTEIVAPASGIITSTSVEVGEIVGPGSAALSMIPEGALQVGVNISENNIVNVKAGQTVRITLDAFGERTWTGEIIHIDPAETMVAGAVYYKATVLFNGPDERIRPGMTASVWIQTDAKDDVLLLPLSAVRLKEGKSFVEVQDGRKITEKEVTLGLENHGIIEIVSGLLPGENAVIGRKP